MNSIWRPCKDGSKAVELNVRADNLLDVIKFLRAELKDTQEALNNTFFNDETLFYKGQDYVDEGEGLINVLEVMFMNQVDGFYGIDAANKVANNALVALGNASGIVYDYLNTDVYDEYK